MRELRLMLTCEHGGNRVPAAFAGLFAGRAAQQALASHRGFDRGALPVARRLARRFAVELSYSTTTRLLVDLNRSAGNPAMLSEFSRGLDPAARERLIGHHYRPYRLGIEQRLVAELAAGASVLHVAVHSFVPVLHGDRRAADIALLYDPGRAAERSLATAWLEAVHERAPALRLRRNYPYRGTSDGLTTALRRLHPDSRYAGIELELNQALIGDAPGQREVADLVGDALAAAVPRLGGPERVRR